MKLEEAIKTLNYYGLEYEDLQEATDTLLDLYEKQKDKQLTYEILIEDKTNTLIEIAKKLGIKSPGITKSMILDKIDNYNKDVTNKYINMIEAFECDFNVINQDRNYYEKQGLNFNLKLTDKLVKDIELLEELSFNLRYNKLKIVEVEENE